MKTIPVETFGARPILYTDSINGEQVCRDDLWLITTAQLRAAAPPQPEPTDHLAAPDSRGRATNAAFRAIINAGSLGQARRIAMQALGTNAAPEQVAQGSNGADAIPESEPAPATPPTSTLPLSAEQIADFRGAYGHTERYRVLCDQALRAIELDRQVAEKDTALHASAPSGCKCSDCYMDREPCPVCYRVWWQKRHPQTSIVCADDSEVFVANKRVRQLERQVAGLRGEWFRKGQESVRRSNQSGCCCKLDDDGATILSVCNAHAEWATHQLAVAQAEERKRIIEIIHGFDSIHSGVTGRIITAILKGRAR